MGAGYLEDRRSHFDCKELGSTPGVKFYLMGNLSKPHNITEIEKGLGRRNAAIKEKDKRHLTSCARHDPSILWSGLNSSPTYIINMCNNIFVHGDFLLISKK